MDFTVDINGKGQCPRKCCLVLFVSFSNFLLVNTEDTDQTPHSVASDLGLHCLSLSSNNDARLIWANAYSCVIKEGFFIWTLIYMYRLGSANIVPTHSSISRISVTVNVLKGN